MTTPLGLRLNNPGNIRDAGIEWQGRVGAEHGFVQFSTMDYGLRALAIDLHSKWKRRLRTVRQIISVYAPPNENDTEAYIASVCQHAGVEPDEELPLDDQHELAVLMAAIIRHEQGQEPFEFPRLLKWSGVALDHA